MNRLAQQLLDHLDDLSSIEIDSDALSGAIDDEESGPLIAALIMELPELRRPALSALRKFPTPDSPSVIRRISAAATLEDEAIDDEIDAWLADPERATPACEALVRAGCDWNHPSLVRYLADPDAGQTAAWLLARAAPGELEGGLDAFDDNHHLLSTCRTISLAGDPQWFEILLEWREQMAADLPEREVKRLDGALATVAPRRYARRALAGELGIDWLTDDRAVADFISRHGPTAWISPTALFRHVGDRPAFELAAALAANAAFTEPFDDVDDERLDPADAARWIADDPHRTAFALAIADDDDIAELFVAATLHETLARRGVQPPPIAGLPLSGPPPKPEELAAHLEPFADSAIDDAGQRVALIRTLSDLRSMALRGHLQRSEVLPVLQRFSDRGDAAGRLFSQFERDESLVGFHDWGCRGIDAVIDQLYRAPHQALHALADAWFDVPTARANVVRTAFSALVAED